MCLKIFEKITKPISVLKFTKPLQIECKKTSISVNVMLPNSNYIEIILKVIEDPC